VVAVHLVVQFQAVVTQAPVAANASHPIDHHRVDAQRAQRCGGGQTGVAATDHQHLRVAVVVANCALPAVEPVGPAELTIECRLLLSQMDCGFVVAVQAAQRREQHSGTRLFASGVRALNAQDPFAHALASFKLEQSFDDRLLDPIHRANALRDKIDLRCATRLVFATPPRRHQAT
jgi:hypothetical protein